MSTPHQNQHYVSQVLLRRFTESGHLQRFDVKANTWKRVSPKRVFARGGYTQLIVDGTIDNSLEESLSKLETKLPIALRALDEAATKRGSADLDKDVFNNLIWYCSFLWSISPFAKAIAPLEFAMQLDLDLKNGRTDLLTLLGIQEKDIATIQDLFSKGTKFIPHANDCLQMLFRIRFAAKCEDTFRLLRYFPKWTLYRSPIELPLSDTAFFKFHDYPSKTTLAVLSIAPQLVLIGTIKSGNNLQASDATTIHTDILTKDEAEYFRDVICLSAITALVCKNRIEDVPACRQRATEKGVSFARIKDLDAVLSAGTKDFTDNLMLMPRTHEAFIQFQKSFIEQKWSQVAEEENKVKPKEDTVESFMDSLTPEDRTRLEEAMTHSFSTYDLDGTPWVNPYTREDLLRVLHGKDCYVVDCNSNWKAEAKKRENSDKAFIIGMTVIGEERNLAGVFFGGKVDICNNNIFILKPSNIIKKPCIEIKRLDVAFRATLNSEAVASKKLKKEKDAESVALEKWTIEHEKQQIFDLMGIKAVDDLPAKKVENEITQKLSTFVQEHAPNCFADFMKSVEVARSCYALLLFRARDLRKEFKKADYDNVFGDMVLIQNALYLQANALSDDHAVKKMMSYIGLSHMRACKVVSS